MRDKVAAFATSISCDITPRLSTSTGSFAGIPIRPMPVPCRGRAFLSCLNLLGHAAPLKGTFSIWSNAAFGTFQSFQS
jgi:hypothetical protein